MRCVWIISHGALIMRHKNTCTAYRPHIAWGHFDCFPGQCRKCFSPCTNILRDDEQAICNSCVLRYAELPSDEVRVAFVKAAIAEGRLYVEQLAPFVHDQNALITKMVADFVKQDDQRRQAARRPLL